jgi:hypothetical protein
LLCLFLSDFSVSDVTGADVSVSDVTGADVSVAGVTGAGDAYLWVTVVNSWRISASAWIFCFAAKNSLTVIVSVRNKRLSTFLGTCFPVTVNKHQGPVLRFKNIFAQKIGKNGVFCSKYCQFLYNLDHNVCF